MSEANTPGYSKKADPKDRLEYLKMEQDYLVSKIKKFKADTYPDKEQQQWYIKIFTDNLNRVKAEITELSAK